MVLYLMGCSKDKQLCDTIQNKEESSGVYYFYFRTNYYNNPQMNLIGGAGITAIITISLGTFETDLAYPAGSWTQRAMGS